MRNLSVIILLLVCLSVFGQENNEYHSPFGREDTVFNSSADFVGTKFHTTVNLVRAVFDTTAEFTVSEFYSTADFSSATFHSTAEFSATQFDSAASFAEAQFDSSADFTNAKFHSSTDFWRAQFHSQAVFGNALFHLSASFHHAAFSSAADFHLAQFESSADFKYVLFKSEANFIQAKFDSTANFHSSEFLSIADFRGSYFYSTADFSRAVFHSAAYLKAAQFYSTANFFGILLPDTLDFSSIIKIKDEIDFTSAKLDSVKKFKNKEYKCQINLVGSDLSKIKINYELFQLYFPEGTRNEDIISTYEKLRQRFKDLGFLESYKSLDIEYQDYKNRKNGDCFLNWFQKTWWNYGYNREQVISWALKFLCFFTLINIFLFEFLQSKVYSINFKFYDKEEFNALKEKSKEERQQRKNIFFSSVMFFKMVWNYFLIKIVNPLVYTMILFFVLKINIENFKKFSGWVLYIWLIYIAGVFCLAYIFNIIIVK